MTTIRFPRNVVYISGGYVNRAPFFKSLKEAYNHVLPLASLTNRYIFWTDSLESSIDDWEDYISYVQALVDSGKAEWGGHIQEGPYAETYAMDSFGDSAVDSFNDWAVDNQ
jgi:hypothetical protein